MQRKYHHLVLLLINDWVAASGDIPINTQKMYIFFVIGTVSNTESKFIVRLEICKPRYAMLEESATLFCLSQNLTEAQVKSRNFACTILIIRYMVAARVMYHRHSLAANTRMCPGDSRSLR